MNLFVANKFELRDYLFANIYLLVIVFTLLSVVLYFIVFKRLFSFLFSSTSVFNKINYILPAFIVLPVVLTVPLLGTFGEEYGYADNAPQIFASDDSSLYVLSSMNHSGRNNYTSYRLHFIDRNSGNEYERSLLPRDFHKRNWKLIDNILWIDNPRYKRVDGINLSDGKNRTIDVELITSMVNQTSIKGISSFQVDFAGNRIKVIRNDGSDTILDPFTNNNKSEMIFHLGVDKTIINFPSDFQFKLKGEIQKNIFLNDSAVLVEKYWIDGLILANLPDNKLFVLFGYDDMNRDKFTLECYNYALDQQWVLPFVEFPEREVSDFYQDGDKLYLIVYRTLVAIDIVRGAILYYCLPF